MKHFYWAVHCKTSNCNSWVAVAYEGEHDGRATYVTPMQAPAAFEYECYACGKTHRYKALDLKARYHPAPPAAGFHDRALF
jgi:hypothetical protein